MSIISRLVGTPTAADLTAQLRSLTTKAQTVADAAVATKEVTSAKIEALAEVYAGASQEERTALEIRRRVLEIVGPE